MELKYDFGDSVYLKTDIDQFERIVTGMTLREGSTVYLLSLGTEETAHYYCEISTEKNLIIS